MSKEYFETLDREKNLRERFETMATEELFKEYFIKQQLDLPNAHKMTEIWFDELQEKYPELIKEDKTEEIEGESVFDYVTREMQNTPDGYPYGKYYITECEKANKFFDSFKAERKLGLEVKLMYDELKKRVLDPLINI